MNHDKIQEQYGYQRHSISDNRYIPLCSGKNEYSTTFCKLVSIQSGEWAIDTYPKVVMKIQFVLLALVKYLFARWVIPLVTISFWILPCFTEFAEFSKIHLGKTLLRYIPHSEGCLRMSNFICLGYNSQWHSIKRISSRPKYFFK